MNFKKNKKFKELILLLIFTFILTLSYGSAYAENNSDNVTAPFETSEKSGFFSGNNVRINEDRSSTTFASGLNVEVNGNIDGDLFVTAQNVTINGIVRGSLFTASQNITINGDVENSIYLAGETLRINSKVNGSAFLAGQDIFVEKGATIEKDAFVGASKLYQNGIITGDLSSSNDFISVGGKIGGDLNYRSNNKAEILKDSVIQGKINWKEIKIGNEGQPQRSIFSSWVMIKIIISIFASLILWLFVRFIRPNFWLNLTEKISIDPLKTLGVGALTVIVTPLIFILLMITVIGIPLGLILLALYAISLFISKIIVSLFIGSWLQRKYNWSNAQTFWPFLISLIFLSILRLIPIIGWVLSFTVVSFGLGSIILSIKKGEQPVSSNVIFKE